jgi:hypothetical protein
MQQQGQEWADKAKSGNISRRNMWVMLDCQLWLQIGYGICNTTATLEELSECMRCIYNQIIPKGGIRGSAPVPIRQFNIGSYSAGFPHPGAECFVSQITKLLIHYGCKTEIGLEMQVSIELFVIKLGISLQLFGESYFKYNNWVTRTWMKSVWKKADKLNISILLVPLQIKLPRLGDKWFMRAVMEAGYRKEEELLILNQFRCHKQFLYLSDVLDASGWALDKKYLSRQQPHETWSKFNRKAPS